MQFPIGLAELVNSMTVNGLELAPIQPIDARRDLYLRLGKAYSLGRVLLIMCDFCSFLPLSFFPTTTILQEKHRHFLNYYYPRKPKIDLKFQNISS
jgi:hypothetical protein